MNLGIYLRLVLKCSQKNVDDRKKKLAMFLNPPPILWLCLTILKTGYMVSAPTSLPLQLFLVSSFVLHLYNLSLLPFLHVLNRNNNSTYIIHQIDKIEN